MGAETDYSLPLNGVAPYPDVVLTERETRAMADRIPIPPAPYETWIEAYLAKYGGFGSDMAGTYAREELEELRAEVEELQAKVSVARDVLSWERKG